MIVTHGTPGVLAAKQATTSIPIVMAVVGDALGSGRRVEPRATGRERDRTRRSFSPELAAKADFVAARGDNSRTWRERRCRC